MDKPAGKKSHKLLWTLGVILVLFIGFFAFVYVKFFMAGPLASLVIDEGTVKYRTASGEEWKAASNGMTLKQGYSVMTLDSSRATILLSNSVFRLDSNTEILLDELTKESVAIKQDSGSTWTRLLKISGIKKYEVSTPDAIASVRGTGFAVYTGNSTEVKVDEGTVNVNSGESSVDAGNGTQVDVNNETQGNLTLDPLEDDDWMQKNRGLDEQHKQEVKKKILEKYGGLISTVQGQYGLTEEDLNSIFDDWYAGKISVKEKIESGEIPSEVAMIIPEEFKRY